MSRPRPNKKTYCSKEGYDFHQKLKKGETFYIVCNLKDRNDWRGNKLPDIESSTLKDGKIYIIEERWTWTNGQVKYKLKGLDRYYHSSKFRQLNKEDRKRINRRDKIKKVLNG